jgi:hypothetical protein
MMIQMICPNLRCRKILSVPADTRGKLVKCQHCQSNIRVPSGRTAETAGAAKPAAH